MVDFVIVDTNAEEAFEEGGRIVSMMDIDERSLDQLGAQWEGLLAPSREYLDQTQFADELDVIPQDRTSPVNQTKTPRLPTWPHMWQHVDQIRAEVDPQPSTSHERGEEASSEWDAMSCVTAQTAKTRSTFYTAASAFGEHARSKPHYLKETDEYAKLLRSKQLWPVDVSVEQDWSGRGQHVEFDDTQQSRDLINETLQYQKSLGPVSTATVQSVKCRRILLARKTILCGKRRMTRVEVIDEVAHLTRLKHAHIVRIIGTYVIGWELSILLYPVAECNLGYFLEEISDGKTALSRTETDRFTIMAMMDSCRRFYLCLANAIEYVHSCFTRHMDIKPQNLLVKSPGRLSDPYRIYIADFGISRSYQSAAASTTDGPTSFTFKYAAPEVVVQEERGLGADIFSLGCVYYEMYQALSWPGNLPLTPEGTSYHSIIETLQGQIVVEIARLETSWNRLDPSSRECTTLRIIGEMVHVDPAKRPCASDLTRTIPGFGCDSCCSGGQVQLEVDSGS